MLLTEMKLSAKIQFPVNDQKRCEGCSLTIYKVFVLQGAKGL